MMCFPTRVALKGLLSTRLKFRRRVQRHHECGRNPVVLYFFYCMKEKS